MNKQKLKKESEKPKSNKSTEEPLPLPTQMNWRPAIVTSIFPLLISATALVWTFVNQHQQNVRWDALNLAAITPTQVGFYAWREISLAEQERLNWGYRAEARASADDLVFRSDKLWVENEVVAYDPGTKTRVDGTFAITVQELEGELKKRNLPDSSHYKLLKHYRLLIRYDNIGATSARVKDQHLDYGELNKFLADQPTDSGASAIQEADRSTAAANSPTVINPHGRLVTYVDIYIPLAKQLPSPWTVELSITFLTVDGDEHKQTTPLIYDRPSGWNWR